MRKKAFWSEKKQNYNLIFVILFFILLGISFIFLMNEYNTINVEKYNFTKNKKNEQQILRIFLRILRKLKLLEKFDFCFKKISNGLENTNKIYNPLNQANLNQDNYTLRKFSYSLETLIFDKCQNNKLSKEIEQYYNFLFNKKQYEFKIVNDYTDYSKVFEDKLCFTSGKAHVALKTILRPKCLEIKNLHIENFYDRTSIYSRTSILLKFNIFKVKKNKIHIYPINKQVISSKHIQLYYSTKQDELVIPFFDKNLMIYKQFFTDNKFIRICNILPLTKLKNYENKFWLEIKWDHKFHKQVCISKLFYLF